MHLSVFFSVQHHDIKPFKQTFSKAWQMALVRSNTSVHVLVSVCLCLSLLRQLYLPSFSLEVLPRVVTKSLTSVVRWKWKWDQARDHGAFLTARRGCKVNVWENSLAVQHQATWEWWIRLWPWPCVEAPHSPLNQSRQWQREAARLDWWTSPQGLFSALPSHPSARCGKWACPATVTPALVNNNNCLSPWD